MKIEHLDKFVLVAAIITGIAALYSVAHSAPMYCFNYQSMDGKTKIHECNESKNYLEKKYGPYMAQNKDFLNITFTT